MQQEKLPARFWGRWIKMLFNPKPYMDYVRTLPDDHPGWKKGKRYQIEAIRWLSINWYSLLAAILFVTGLCFVV